MMSRDIYIYIYIYFFFFLGGGGGFEKDEVNCGGYHIRVFGAANQFSHFLPPASPSTSREIVFFFISRANYPTYTGDQCNSRAPSLNGFQYRTVLI